ncbi:MAG: HAMP domain-containing protein [Deltaproteobacteria bacterium]|nr:HAMP domain-containing protein [Deltaproteobacteria bacterium]
MAESKSPSPAEGGRHQRRFRNYLIDAHFQLKYAGYLVGIAALLSAALGTILYRTSEAVIAQSRESVAVGEQVVERGRDVVGESKKVNAVVQMSIVRDPAYADNPALLAAFQSDAKTNDDKLSAQQARLEEQASRLKAQSEALAAQQRTMGSALVAVLAALVVAVGVAGIVITHRVAGPIFKMKKQLRELANGDYRIPFPLRKGDELVDFFEEFRSMVSKLRGRQESEIHRLDTAIQNLAERAPAETLSELRALRDEMQRSLG